MTGERDSPLFSFFGRKCVFSFQHLAYVQCLSDLATTGQKSLFFPFYCFVAPPKVRDDASILMGGVHMEGKNVALAFMKNKLFSFLSSPAEKRGVMGMADALERG